MATVRSRRVSVGLVDLSHSACAERRDDRVRTEAAAGAQGHSVIGLPTSGAS